MPIFSNTHRLRMVAQCIQAFAKNFEVSRIAWNSFNLQDFSWIHAGFGLDVAHSWKDWLTAYNGGYYVIPILSPI